MSLDGPEVALAHVKAYTRKSKSGKIVHVKAYTNSVRAALREVASPGTYTGPARDEEGPKQGIQGAPYSMGKDSEGRPGITQSQAREVERRNRPQTTILTPGTKVKFKSDLGGVEEGEIVGHYFSYDTLGYNVRHSVQGKDVTTPVLHTRIVDEKQGERKAQESTKYARHSELEDAINKAQAALAGSKSKKGVSIGDIAYHTGWPPAKVKAAVQRQIESGNIVNDADKPGQYRLRVAGEKLGIEGSGELFVQSTIHNGYAVKVTRLKGSNVYRVRITDPDSGTEVQTADFPSEKAAKLHGTQMANNRSHPPAPEQARADAKQGIQGPRIQQLEARVANLRAERQDLERAAGRTAGGDLDRVRRALMEATAELDRAKGDTKQGIQGPIDEPLALKRLRAKTAKAMPDLIRQRDEVARQLKALRAYNKQMGGNHQIQNQIRALERKQTRLTGKIQFGY